MESLGSTRIKFTSALYVTKHYVTTGNIHLSKAIDKHYRNQNYASYISNRQWKVTRLKINAVNSKLVQMLQIL